MASPRWWLTLAGVALLSLGIRGTPARADVVPGDKIMIETLQGKFTYEVIPQAGPNGEQAGNQLQVVKLNGLAAFFNVGDGCARQSQFIR